MIKPLLLLASLLFVMVTAMLIHANSFDRKVHLQTLQHMTKLTGDVKLSYSLKYDDTKRNTTYPDMPSLGTMDFVYE